MKDKYDGPERRQYSDDIAREIYEFMARIDQRNQDRDIAHAVQDELCDKCQDRLTSLEASREYCKGVTKAVGIGVPAFGSVAWLIYEFGSALKKLKGGG